MKIKRKFYPKKIEPKVPVKEEVKEAKKKEEAKEVKTKEEAKEVKAKEEAKTPQTEASYQEIKSQIEQKLMKKEAPKKSNGVLWPSKIKDGKFPVEFIKALSEMASLIDSLAKEKSYLKVQLDEVVSQQHNSALKARGNRIDPNMIQKKEQSEEEKKLKESVERGKKALGPESEDKKKINLILNQLTPDNFGTMKKATYELLYKEVAQISTLYVNHKADFKNELKKLDSMNHNYFLSYLFKKAEKEKKYKKIYGKLLTEVIKDISDKQYKTAFKTILLRISQDRFETLTNNLKDLHNENSTKTMDKDSLEDEKRRCRDLFFGNIRFLGELFSLKQLSQKIIVKYMLLPLMEPKDIDNKDIIKDYKIAAIELLEVMGSKLEEKVSKGDGSPHKKNKGNVSPTKNDGKPKFLKSKCEESPVKKAEAKDDTKDKEKKEKSDLSEEIKNIFKKIEGWAKCTNEESLVLFKSKNLMDRRNNNWADTRMSKNDPQTLKELHKQIDEEEEFSYNYNEDANLNWYDENEDDYKEKDDFNKLSGNSYKNKKRTSNKSYVPTTNSSSTNSIPKEPEKTPAELVTEIYNEYKNKQKLSDIPASLTVEELIPLLMKNMEDTDSKQYDVIRDTFGKLFEHILKSDKGKDKIILQIRKYLYGTYTDCALDAIWMENILTGVLGYLMKVNLITLLDFLPDKLVNTNEDYNDVLITLLMQMVCHAQLDDKQEMKYIIDILTIHSLNVIPVLLADQATKIVKYEPFFKFIMQTLKKQNTLELVDLEKKRGEFANLNSMLYPTCHFMSRLYTQLAKTMQGSDLVKIIQPVIFFIENIFDVQEENAFVVGLKEWEGEADAEKFLEYNRKLPLFQKIKVSPTKKKSIAESPSK